MSNVSRVIETNNDPTTVRALLRSDLPSAVLPNSIGSNGNIHGASTVKTPATNETNIRFSSIKIYPYS